METSPVMLLLWAVSAIVSAVVIRRRRYEGGLAIGLLLFAVFGGPTALAFFLPWGSAGGELQGASGRHTAGPPSSDGTDSIPR